MSQVKSFLLTFIMLFMSIGCSNTHIIKPDEPIHIKKQGTLYKKDLERIDIGEFYSLGDSIIALHYYTNELLEFSKSDVTKIVVRNRFKGALQGAFIGAFGPSSLCYIICEDNPQDALGSKEAGAFLLFLMGGPIGAITGFDRGSKDIYEFVTDRSSATENKKESDDPDVDQTKPPAIVIVKDPEIEKIRAKKKMISTSKKPSKIPKNYYVLRGGAGFGDIPTINNPDESTINEKIGPGFAGTYQLWSPVRSNIYVGISVGGIGFSQEDGGVTTTWTVENFGLTTQDVSQENELLL